MPIGAIVWMYCLCAGCLASVAYDRFEWPGGVFAQGVVYPVYLVVIDTIEIDDFMFRLAQTVQRQPSWPVPTTTLAGGAERKTGMPVWRAAPPV